MLDFEKIAELAYEDEMDKLAAFDDDDISWIDKQRAITRAVRGKNTVFSSPEYLGELLSDAGLKGGKGAIAGAGVGGLIGAIATLNNKWRPSGYGTSVGALIGGLSVGAAGAIAGLYTGREKYLRERGIIETPFSAHLNSDAIKNYVIQ